MQYVQRVDELRERGIKLVSIQLGLDPSLRASAPWLLGGVKSTSYAVNMAAEAEAKRRGADDAVFLGSGDVVLEGPVTNVWWRYDEVLYTPALELGILAGVTRATLVEEAAAAGYEVREGVFPLEHLAQRRDAKPLAAVREPPLGRVELVAGIDALQLRGGQPLQRTGAICRAFEGGVVVHHDHAVARQLDVELEAIGTEREAVLEGRERVLGPER